MVGRVILLMSALGFDAEHVLFCHWLPAGDTLNTTRHPVKLLSVRNGGNKIAIFWDLSPCSMVYVYRCFGGVPMPSSSEYLISLKMKTSCFSETLVTVYQNTRCHIVGDYF
jgi:hypothetical protein